MDRLYALLKQISAQLAVLTVSQRLAIGLCAALIAASLLWLLQWSTAPDMVPVFTGEFSWKQLSEVEGSLKINGIDYQMRGRRVLVRAKDRNNAIRILHESDAVPDDGGLDIEWLIENTSPFKAESDKAYERNVAWGNKLAEIITTSPLVTRASVMINPTTKRRVGFKGDVPTASVNVTLKSGQKMTQQMVRGLAGLVSRAVSGLEPHNVEVIDGTTLRKYSVPAPDEADAVGFLDEIKKHEQHLQAKVMEVLAYIPNVIVNVSVELDNTRSKTEKQTFDKPQLKTEDTKSDETNAPETSGEAGANANLGMGLSSGAGGGSSNSEDSKTEFFPPNVKEKTTVQKVAPDRRRVTASIMVPRSWIVSVYQIVQPDAANPTDDELKPVKTIELKKIEDSVAATILADASDITKNVKVDVYPDLDHQGQPLGGPYVAAAQAAGMDAVTVAKTYGPQVGLALLALLSLVMMMRVVRKSADLARADEREDLHGGQAEGDEDAELYVADGAVGRAVLSGGFLEGQELDENEMRYQELSEQVSNLVDGDPSAAAELISGWIKEND